ncbi:MAG: CoA ester lyase, partial [Pseudomonadota bacterium]
MNSVIRPRRSVLYMPGINERALEKAKSIPADSLILDLEDSVAPDSKEAARALVCERVAAGGYGSREIIIRINGLDSEWGEADLEAAARTGADGILVPKVNSADEILDAAERRKEAGGAASQQVWAMIETPLGVLNAQQIGESAAEANLTCLVLGTNDLLKETRAQFVPERAPVLAWLSTAVIAARAYGLDVIDGVYNN